MGKEKKKVETTGVRSGLLWAIVSLILFFTLRYGIFVSLFFATLTGFSVGLILRWWHSSEGPRTKLHLFAQLEKRPQKKRYPGLKEIAEYQSRRGSLNQRRQKQNQTQQQKTPGSEPSGET